jgi:superfamily II DNA/RNA helicase
MVYADNIDVGQRIVRFLISLLPPHLQNAGIIRPYNARLTQCYRALAMKDLQAGNIRVLVCTDAAGMVSVIKP